MELRQRVELGTERRTRLSQLDALRGGPASGGVPLLLKLIRAVDLAQREIIGLLFGLQGLAESFVLFVPERALTPSAIYSSLRDVVARFVNRGLVARAATTN